MASAVISRNAPTKHLFPVVVMNPNVHQASPCVASLGQAPVNLGSVSISTLTLQLVSFLFENKIPMSDVLIGGGCLQAAPSGNAPVTGLNCKDIKDIKSDTVTCGKGHCIVNDCIEGFFVAPAKDSCIPLPQSATAGSKGSAAITADGSSGSTEGVKVSRDELTGGLAHGAGANPLVGGAQGACTSIPVGSGFEGTTSARVTRDVVQDATGVNPILVAVRSIAAGHDGGSLVA